MPRPILVAMIACVATAACASRAAREGHGSALHGGKGTLVALAFLSPDCPIANAMIPDMKSIAREARNLGIRFVAVYPVIGTDDTAIARHARDFAFDGEFPTMLDRDQSLARAVGATVTPEGALLRLDGAGGFETLYLGRVNNLYSAIGRRRALPTENDLLGAMRAAREGRAIGHPAPKAVGCFIEFPSSSSR